jgi:ATP/maltotriose-dependent transcriptional regulator MalT
MSEADQADQLAGEDLERLATVAHLIGRDDDETEIGTRAYQAYLRQGSADRAARGAFWLAFGLLGRGEHARAAGWVARARRLIDEVPQACVEQGYLLFLDGLQSVGGGDATAATSSFERAAEVAERFGDQDLEALAQLGLGGAKIPLGETAAGVALLDEVMVAVAADELSPAVTGIVYCAVIEVCQEIFDLARARQWTAALTRWCESQPDLVPYRGQCLAHRAEIMQLHGAWQDAMEEAQRAGERLSQPPGQPAVGMAVYLQAEIHRLRGEISKAEDAYRRASQIGRQPQPGLALLRLAEGRVEVAAAAIRRVMDEVADRTARSKLLAAYVEIMLADGDLMSARAGADELAQLADALAAPLLVATAAQARGAVLLAEGDAQAALIALRKGWALWQDLEVPYQAARVRVQIGLACRQLGDEDGAKMELDAARWVFRDLGAELDLASVDALTRKAPASTARGLTERELEVLRLVAAGETNRAIATDLFLSERTVDRHLSNILAKLGVSSRTAATSYAYKHMLL